MLGKLTYHLRRLYFRMTLKARGFGGLARDWWTPPRLFVGSFLLLIFLGTLGLKELPGLYTGEPLG